MNISFIKRLVDSHLSYLVNKGLLIKSDMDMLETKNGDTETVYSISLLIANDLADTHEKDGTVEEFQYIVLDYIYSNDKYIEYF